MGTLPRMGVNNAPWTWSRLTNIHYKDLSNVTLERHMQTYDRLVNITQVLDAANAKWDYAYDDRYRLTQAERRLGTTLKHRHTYGYDGADNVSSQAVYNATANTTNSITYTNNAANELTQAVFSATGTTTYAYDSWGRLTTITQGTRSATLGWAYQDRLKSYTTTLTGETSVNYSYSGDGHRIGVDNTNLGQGPKKWTYDTKWGVRSQSYPDTPANDAWYVLEPNGTVLAETPSSGAATNMRYYLRDHLGSTRSVRLENTSKYAWFEYEPYGKLYSSGGFFNLLWVQDRFTGHEFDYETNMFWAPYRNYRPDMLRWISRDPLGMVDGPNVYGYVAGRTMSFVDLTGKSALPVDNLLDLINLMNQNAKFSGNTILCLIWKESTGSPCAKSETSSATGLMQMTKGAAKAVGCDHSKMTDPAENIRCGILYLEKRLSWCNGNIGCGLDGYGTGPGYSKDILDCASCLGAGSSSTEDCLSKVKH